MKYVYVLAWSFVAGYSKERGACTVGCIWTPQGFYLGVYFVLQDENSLKIAFYTMNSTHDLSSDIDISG